MKKNKILVLALLACFNMPGFAQGTDNNITGFIVDKWGHPVYGASVNVAGNPYGKVTTDKNGKFEITADKNQKLQISSADKGTQTVAVEPGKPMTIVMGYAAQTIDVGANQTLTRAESFYFV